MDLRRAPPLEPPLLLLLLLLPLHFTAQRPPLPQRRAALSEYLVPPPPPTFHRTGRLAGPPPPPPTTAAPGYFSKLMTWLNPFSYNGQYLPPPPQLPPLPPPQQPPLPPPQFPPLQAPGYLPPKQKHCNPCNKVPWIPVQTEFPLLPPPVLPPIGGPAYLPPDPHIVSQEIRPPDFAFVSNSPPIPNPHLFPGPMPPLFKAKPFDGKFGDGSLVDVTSSFRVKEEEKEDLYSSGSQVSNVGPGNLGKIEGGKENYGIPGFLEPPREFGVTGVVFRDGGKEKDGLGENHSYGTVNSGVFINDGGKGVRQGFSKFGEEFHGIPPGIRGYNNREVDVSTGNGGIPQNSAQGHEYAATINRELGSLGSSKEFQQHLQNTKNSVAEFQNVRGNSQEFDGRRPDFLNSGTLESSQSLPSSSRQEFQQNSAGTNGQVFNQFNREFLGNLPSSSGSYGDALKSAGNPEFQHSFGTNLEFIRDSSKSVGFQHSSASSTQEFQDPSLHSAINQELFDRHRINQEFPASSGIDHQSSIPNKEFYASHIAKEFHLTEIAPESSKTTNSNLRPSSNSYANSNNILDLASSGSSQDSRVKSSEENSIHFEESPLLDLTKNSESRTDSGETVDSKNSEDSTKVAAENSATESHSDLEFLSYSAESGKDELQWSSVTTLKPLRLEFEEDSAESSTEFRDLPKQGVKRNKQVQVIIPYTSQYTPLPFHQPSNDWSLRNEGSQQRKEFSHFEDTSRDNYLSQESRGEVKLTDPLESKIFEVSSTTELSPSFTNDVNSAEKNNSIDVHRLQKNIDNWTIQEYSRGTTSSTVLPSSSRPYLLPSKKIPQEYFTTTESSHHREEGGVKTFALAGFSFNDLEHEGSASSRVEATRVQVIHAEAPEKSVNLAVFNSNESTADKRLTKNPNYEKIDVFNPNNRTLLLTTQSAWQQTTVSPENGERVYVVTPSPLFTTFSTRIAPTAYQILTTTSTSRIPTNDEVGSKSLSLEVVPTQENTTELPRDERSTERSEKSEKTDERKGKRKPSEGDLKKSKNKFESIEKAYQVLPQAVNSLAVAFTGPENVPLWGIMEHEEFASINDEMTTLEEEEGEEERIGAPVLYSGHSKVSRARR